MGAIEDIRKAIEDVVAPDLKAIVENVKSLEAKMDTLDKHLSEKIVTGG